MKYENGTALIGNVNSTVRDWSKQVSGMRHAEAFRREFLEARPFISGKVTVPSWDLLRAPIEKVAEKYRA